MGFSTDDQRAAIGKLWPEIESYCAHFGLTRDRLLTGSNGVPLDGPKVMKARALALLTRRELAVRAGVGFDVIGKYENETRDPSAAALDRLCQAMHCEVRDLLRDIPQTPA